MNRRDDFHGVMWFRSRRIAEDMLPIAAKSFHNTGGKKCFSIEVIEAEYTTVKRFYILTWRSRSTNIIQGTSPKLIGAFLKGYMKAKGIRD